MIYESLINLVLISVVFGYYPSDNTRVYPNEYPPDYDPDKPLDPDHSLDRNHRSDRDQRSDPERISFDGIYERRKNFDVETPMEFPSESHPESEELNDDRYHPSSDTSEPSPDYPMYSSDDNNPPPSDDYVSESQNELNSKSFLTDGCLRCLCEASSDCDPQVRCHVEGPTDYNCGPFQVDLNYWNDAGSPGADQNDPLDFENCANDIECAIETVNGFMKKYSKDCDGDGRVSCDDYAKIHKAGAHQCNNSWIVNTPYWNKYKECYFEY